MSEEVKDQEIIEESEPVVDQQNEEIETPTVDEVIEEIKSDDEPEVTESKKRRGRPRKANAAADKEVEEIDNKSEKEESIEKVDEPKEQKKEKLAKAKKSKDVGKILTQPTDFYVAMNQKPKCKISGPVTVLNDMKNGWLEINYVMKGVGKVHGYIRK